MMIREPSVAGLFYPDTLQDCRTSLNDCLDQSAKPSVPITGRVLGGIVPHAGWVYSGRVAGRVFSALADSDPHPTVVVLFGAVHHRISETAVMFSEGRWQTPLGSVEIDGRLAERVLGHTNLIQTDPYAHEKEHSIEVQVPFIQQLLPDAKILPVLVTPSDRAVEVGQSIAGTLKSYDYRAAVIASSDLTHYGERYGFAPMGSSKKGLEWAKQINDRRQIDCSIALDAAAAVKEAREHRNACGAGAVAAAIGACKRLGATRGVLLEHTTSWEIAGAAAGDNAVGYAGIVFVDDTTPV